MNLIDITSIIVGPRQRTDYRDLDRLAESIQHYGLIQPVVIDRDHNLIAGGRRLAACKQLGMTHIPCHCYDELNEVDRAEMELEENVRREALPWQDRCRAIASIHALRSKDAALSSKEWGYAETGELLDMRKGNVWYAIRVAEMLNAGDEAIAKCENMHNAVQLLLDRKAKLVEDMIMPEPVAAATPSEPLQRELHLDPMPGSTKSPINITLVFGDCLDWLAKQPNESIDHIYTDPPYAIDMDNIDQEGIGSDMSLVAGTHDVEENLLLLPGFISAAARVLRDTSYLVFWCDQDNWGLLRGCAESAGLRVQRWPLVWIKTHACQNGQAYRNFTKSTEIAMLCAKPKAQLATTRSTNYWEGATDKAGYQVTNPFWKPTALHRWILSAIATKGSHILDPFAGCGSIPLAALQSGYNCTAVEKDSTHFVQLQRITGLLSH